MKTFREWLTEKQFKKGSIVGLYTSGIMEVTVFINPTIADWKILGPNTRGIISEKGDLYIATGSGAYKDGQLLIHADLIEYLRAVVPMGHFNADMFQNVEISEMRILPVQRFETKRAIYFSESLPEWNILGNPDEVKYIEKLYKKAKSKNKTLTFHLQSVNLAS